MTSDNNLVVQGLWIGGRLSTLERLCIRSFCAHGHEFHLYHYDALQNVPQVNGLRLMDGADILPRTAIFRTRHGSLAIFSDLFRWELLRQKGGWWSDMDSVCLRPLDLAGEIALGYADTEESLINTGMMKFPRGHFMPAAMADACANVNKFMPWDDFRYIRRKLKRILLFRNSPKHVRWGETGGPPGVTLAIKHFGLEKHVLPMHVFYPIHCKDAPDLFDGSPQKAAAVGGDISEAHAAHFYNEIIRGKGIDKDGKFPVNSPYEILKRRYGEAKE